MALVKPSQLAEILGITPQAVTKAVRLGRLVKGTKDRNYKIDTEHYLTVEFIRDNNPHRQNISQYKDQKKEEKSKKSTFMEEEEPESFEETKEKVITIKAESDYYGYKENLELEEKKLKNEKLRLQIEIEKGTYIPFEKVEKLFGNIAASILSHWLPMGDRLSVLMAGHYGCNDPIKNISAKEMIDAEIIRAVTQVKNKCKLELQENE